MPSLAVPMKPLADSTFVAQGKRLPVGWSQPTGSAADHYRMAFGDGEHSVATEPGCYFTPASTNRHHVDQCRLLGERFQFLCHGLLDGFSLAMDQWRGQAMFQGLVITGPVVTGGPGCLSGPELAPWIKAQGLPDAQGHQLTWRDAIAEGLSACFADWQNQVTVPGLPWYPAFAAFPGPLAPPMPNVPMPLSSCSSSAAARMSAAGLKQAMCDQFGRQDQDDQFGALATAIGTAVSTAFTSWLSMQQVMGVLGTGPVPTFAPPLVPGGPVLGGSTIPAPGHLAV